MPMFTLPLISDVAAPGIARGSGLFQQELILSGLAHDLRQPLSVIEVCVDYLDLVLPECEPETRQQLELLRLQVDNANRLICEALCQWKMTYGGAEPLHAQASASRPSTNAASAAVIY
jgi:K+-sensing histidine kinase KdpD